MQDQNIHNYIKDVIRNMPSDWLNLTTHRLDIYNEAFAKTEFLEQFEILYNSNNTEASALNDLPTAFDYIRLGHPLSCVLEWTIACLHNIHPENVISFSSKTAPILAVLRKNRFANTNTQIVYTGQLPETFDVEIIRTIYGYQFNLVKVDSINEVSQFNGSTIFISQDETITNIDLNSNIDFYISMLSNLGSIIIVNGEINKDYISEIQHVRRRETIAMTPANTLSVLKAITKETVFETKDSIIQQADKTKVLDTITNITNAYTKPLVSSSGLSIQYAILMGLVHDALEQHKGKAIKIIVPPNCYGGTNDQARRIAACIDNVDIVDLPVDGGNDMVKSIDTVLTKIASENAVPYIIAEIPTNPRVEVPDLIKLRDVLSQERKTATGEIAIDPVFILDQTFCPNVHFLGDNDILSTVRTISFASGSKFPSGGKCTAGYCVGNKKTETLMHSIELHLGLCDNEATALQYKILAEQLPSMNQRIADAYRNTRDFVNYITEVLPEAKINFVSEILAEEGFTPSVFSLDLPTKGNTDEEREVYKRALNLKLINLMITKIPNESKYCVSYGQLKGCYWTIPATSTQGTTKEGDKDYIARVALSPNMDLALHKKVFLDFVKGI
ncbi:PLP-dependent aminotransferase family protein [Winogradskyella immobilis]|uniref:PLP-dependent transferase n=1 Tax=Winogradskyella immobilis TaxID=2816852 RepID=A0ABS8EQX1_9FLAO|nr:PLP-dependent transferase [Winogradskyella immobilis]MCC1485406.1 PLP-dependent transferase [Winogradskyella immobilis]MCG0017498.1 PLP-dependent transferase [Winogradskyella immobilis]